MARRRILITDFSAGMVSSRVMGRLDMPFQQKTVELLDGFIVRADGGVSRRRGTILVRRGLGISPSADGLFGQGTIPAFAVVRRGEIDGTERPWLVWIANTTPPELKAQQLQTRATTTVPSESLEPGKAIIVSDTFYSEPDPDNVVSADDQHIYLTTPDSAHTVHVGSGWTIQLQEERHMGVVFQNRLVATSRPWGTVWMSKPLHMFEFDVFEDVVVQEAVAATDGTEQVTKFYVAHSHTEAATVTVPDDDDGDMHGKHFFLDVKDPDGATASYTVVVSTSTIIHSDGPGAPVRVDVRINKDATGETIAGMMASKIEEHISYVTTRLEGAELTIEFLFNESGFADGNWTGTTSGLVQTSTLEKTFITFAAIDANGDEQKYLVWMHTGTASHPDDVVGTQNLSDHTPIQCQIVQADTPAQVGTKIAAALTGATYTPVFAASYATVTHTGWQHEDYVVTITGAHVGPATHASRGTAPWITPTITEGTEPWDGREAVIAQIQTGAVEIIPDYYGSERVRWIAGRQSLYLGTDSGEYEITSAFPYFSNEPGGAILEPISRVGTDGIAFFGETAVLRSGDRLLRLMFTGGQYQSASIAELLDNDEIITHLAVDYGSHRYLLALDINQDLYCMTESPSTQVSGWSLLATGVWWIAKYQQDVYIARLLGDDFAVEMLPLDSLHYPGNRSATTRLQFARANAHSDFSAFYQIGATTGDNSGDQLPPSSTFGVLKWTGTGWESLTTELMTNAAGVLDDGQEWIQGQIGYTDTPIDLFLYRTSHFTSRLKTLPLQIPAALGPALGKSAIVREVVVVVHESRGMRVRTNEGAWETWTVDAPYSGTVPFLVEGTYDEMVQVEIESIAALPLTISSIQADVEVSEP